MKSKSKPLISEQIYMCRAAIMAHVSGHMYTVYGIDIEDKNRAKDLRENIGKLLEDYFLVFNTRKDYL